MHGARMQIANWWLKDWSAAVQGAEAAEGKQPDEDPVERPGREDLDTLNAAWYLGVYNALSIAAILAQTLRSLSIVVGSLGASRRLHEGLLGLVLRLPMRFFEVQPAGRLLNRFTRDLEKVDMSLGNDFESLANFGGQLVFNALMVSLAGGRTACIQLSRGERFKAPETSLASGQWRARRSHHRGASRCCLQERCECALKSATSRHACLLTQVTVVSPPIALLFGALSFVYLRVLRIYVATSREVKRVDSVQNSPIFSHFNEIITGITTVRAFGASLQGANKNEELVNKSTRAHWPSTVLNRWLSVQLEMVGNVVIFVTALLTCAVGARGAGMAGLALASAVNLTGLLNWVVRCVSDVEVDMNAVERICEYLDEPTEAPLHVSCLLLPLHAHVCQPDTG